MARFFTLQFPFPFDYFRRINPSLQYHRLSRDIRDPLHQHSRYRQIIKSWPFP
jgi:hypothetical protein